MKSAFREVLGQNTILNLTPFKPKPSRIFTLVAKSISFHTPSPLCPSVWTQRLFSSYISLFFQSIGGRTGGVTLECPLKVPKNHACPHFLAAKWHENATKSDFSGLWKHFSTLSPPQARPPRPCMPQSCPFFPRARRRETDKLGQGHDTAGGRGRGWHAEPYKTIVGWTGGGGGVRHPA